MDVRYLDRRIRADGQTVRRIRQQSTHSVHSIQLWTNDSLPLAEETLTTIPWLSAPRSKPPLEIRTDHDCYGLLTGHKPDPPESRLSEFLIGSRHFADFLNGADLRMTFEIVNI